MFVHDNGKVSVLCMTRCGHTSMYDYFNIPRYSLNQTSFKVWWNSSSIKVLVLRNPIERMCSAYKTTELLHKDQEFFTSHCSPYLHFIPLDLNFKIINFDQLKKYIPFSLHTNPTHTNIKTDEYIENNLFTKKQLIEEYSRYQFFINTKDEVSSDEWKELTT